MKTFTFSLVLRTRENTDVFITLDENIFGIHSKKVNILYVWSCQKVCEAFTNFLDNIFIRFGNKIYRQIVGIPMGTNCAPLVADLLLFCYERDFMLCVSVMKLRLM